MKTYQEPAKEILVSREVDVLVVGSGPAGIGAAIRAGRALSLIHIYPLPVRFKPGCAVHCASVYINILQALCHTS